MGGAKTSSKVSLAAGNTANAAAVIRRPSKKLVEQPNRLQRAQPTRQLSLLRLVRVAWNL